MNIQWFPGHMAKTRRLIGDNLKLVDVVVELLDARIPYSSANPIMNELLGNKPRVVAFNKSDMANSGITKQWIDYYKQIGIDAVAINSISGNGINRLKDAVQKTLHDKIQRDLQKGMRKRPIRMMAVGIPNVGKSSFINKICGRASAKTGDRPGVTKAKQWLKISGRYELLDTPGILWPKFDENTGLKLAFTGAVRDEVYDVTEVASKLCIVLANIAPDTFKQVYKLNDLSKKGHEILHDIGVSRGCLASGGIIDYERAANILLDDFRGCKLGRITLEMPGDIEGNEYFDE